MEPHRSSRRPTNMRNAMLGLMAICLLAAGACGGDDGPTGSGDPLVGRTFVSQTVVGRDLVPDTTIRLEFTADEVRVHAGCNHLSGVLESSGGGVLQISGVGATEMGCPPELHEQDEWIAELLASDPSWSLDGDELTLSSDTVEIAMLDREVADPDRALEGTTWIVDTLFSGGGPDGAATNPPAGPDAHLLFEDGRVSGSTGCNELSGRYEIEGSTITIEDLVQTDMACETALMGLEAAVTSMAGVPLDHEIEADRLRLTKPSGDGLGLHADDT